MSTTRTYMSAALAAFAGILFFILVMPTWDEVSARRAALDERRQVVADRNAILAKLNDLKKQSAARAGDIKQFANVVPAGKNAADLVSMIQTIASQNGLQLTGLAMGASSGGEKTDYAAQSLDFAVTGSYLSFRSFIDTFEKNIRIIDVESIDGAPTTENSPIIGFRIKAHAYFLP